MLERDDYPAGVPCWVDLVQPDLDATMAFYRGLFGWDFEIRTPEGAPSRYAYARLDGLTVGGVGGTAEAGPAGWVSYVCVESADDVVATVEVNGGRVVTAPADIPRSGRVAVVADPDGAVIGVWQPAELRGAQLVNAPGSWNFSELRTRDLDGARAFYGAVFGWECDPLDMGTEQPTQIWRVKGYGEHLAARDPEIRERQAADQAPDGFADAVALVTTAAAGDVRAPAWGVTFSVDDADAALARAVDLGATVVTPLFDTTYTRMGEVRDPQGAVLTLSQYRPPAS